ncbi:MAG: type II toxin-antitoxin system PemK/MazF family toxin, partial [Candidatus Humimicrobiaceae bacterium]
NIFWANLDPIRGSEQRGVRPVIVISAEEINQALAILAVIPLTSMRPGRNIYSTEIFLGQDESGLEKDSIAMAHQIRVISKERLLDMCGKITSSELKDKIKMSVKTFMDLL